MRFCWLRRCIAGRRVVLVDDVKTSGATLLSLAKALKEAEPSSLCSAGDWGVRS